MDYQDLTPHALTTWLAAALRRDELLTGDVPGIAVRITPTASGNTVIGRKRITLPISSIPLTAASSLDELFDDAVPEELAREVSQLVLSDAETTLHVAEIAPLSPLPNRRLPPELFTRDRHVIAAALFPAWRATGTSRVARPPPTFATFGLQHHRTSTIEMHEQIVLVHHGSQGEYAVELAAGSQPGPVTEVTLAATVTRSSTDRPRITRVRSGEHAPSF